ncbi:PhzF family phenazine biosynthesis protein [Leptothrix discophora]|uniref:PhzF family phenazine biosynthesis protein n=1 Tax=Leptothrix discophora TaxID=89 RepID=A0ABT9G4V7_LEPDI|nr:PhzF family phenazine biosynthesis protein [Leptothrix discophora]MDP4301307.1 PhzF family phenazine biosynthesis protein [Leptothrix discophora]
MPNPSRRYAQVDVFSAVPLLGNPLAVVVDAEGLDDATMQAFARWTQLSETTFLLPPTDPAADYRVRIFTPGRELPFAGHPTLGSCQVWLDHGGRPQHDGEVVQQCGVGLVRIRRQVREDGHARLAFAAPPLRRSGPVDAGLHAQVLAALQLPAEAVRAVHWVDNGPPWIAALLHDAAAVNALRPDPAFMRGLELGVVGAYPQGSDLDFEVRAFVPELGVPEDPVTGSLNAGIAQWLIGAGLAPRRYVAGQGRALGRDGRIHVEAEAGADGDTVWIGGDVCGLIAGSVRLS